MKRNLLIEAVSRKLVTAFIVFICSKSLSQNASAQGLETLVDAPRNSVIPATVYLEHDSRSIGETIVKRAVNRDAQVTSSEAKTVDQVLDMEIRLFSNWSPETVNGIVNFGFLNYHQTGRSGGIPIDREGREDTFLDIKMEEKLNGNPLAHYLRPKYAAAFYRSLPGGARQGTQPRHYGGIIAVFKEEVKKRATWTNGDSLNFRDETPKTFQYPYHGGKTEPYEIQIYGALDATDVKHFLVTKNIPDSAIRQLATTGVAIYTFETNQLIVPADENLKSRYEAHLKKRLSARMELEAQVYKQVRNWKILFKQSRHETADGAKVAEWINYLSAHELTARSLGLAIDAQLGEIDGAVYSLLARNNVPNLRQHKLVTKWVRKICLTNVGLGKNLIQEISNSHRKDWILLFDDMISRNLYWDEIVEILVRHNVISLGTGGILSLFKRIINKSYIGNRREKLESLDPEDIMSLLKRIINKSYIGNRREKLREFAGKSSSLRSFLASRESAFALATPPVQAEVIDVFTDFLQNGRDNYRMDLDYSESRQRQDAQLSRLQTLSQNPSQRDTLVALISSNIAEEHLAIADFLMSDSSRYLVDCVEFISWVEIIGKRASWKVKEVVKKWVNLSNPKWQQLLRSFAANNETMGAVFENLPKISDVNFRVELVEVAVVNYNSEGSFVDINKYLETMTAHPKFKVWKEAVALESGAERRRSVGTQAVRSEGGPVGKLRESSRNDGGGSTWGKWFMDESGTEWYLKRENQHRDLQTSAEVISSGIYRKLGYTAPFTTIVEIDGVKYSASKSLGNKLTMDTQLANIQSAEFRQMRIVAAFLKDWDRMKEGPNNFNLGGGEFAVFDFGGTLGSRARGQYKPGTVVSAAVGSFENTSDFAQIYEAFQVRGLSEGHPWESVTPDDAHAIASKFKTLLTDSFLETLVASARYTSPRDSTYMLQALKARRNAIVDGAKTYFERKGAVGTVNRPPSRTGLAGTCAKLLSM